MNGDQNTTSKLGGSRQQQTITNIINTIKTHISSFPTEISHCNRSHGSENITYLEDNITLSDMLSDFNSTHEQTATYWLYYKTLHTQFKTCFKNHRRIFVIFVFPFKIKLNLPKNLRKEDLKIYKKNISYKVIISLIFVENHAALPKPNFQLI